MNDAFSTDIKNRELHVEIELTEFVQKALDYTLECMASIRSYKNQKGDIAFNELMLLLKNNTDYDNLYLGIIDVLRSFDQIFYDICRVVNYFADTFMDPYYWDSLARRTNKVDLKLLGVLL